MSATVGCFRKFGWCWATLKYEGQYILSVLRTDCDPICQIQFQRRLETHCDHIERKCKGYMVAQHRSLTCVEKQVHKTAVHHGSSAGLCLPVENCMRVIA